MTELRETLQQTLGDSYRIDRELGGGGMSRVYAATDTTLGRNIVVKVLAPELSAAVNVERFQREIQLAARLQHAYIVPLLSAGVADGLPYYTMPLVEGETLRHRIDRSGELPIPDTTKILRDVAEALSYAHEHGVVHRDIKPENVLLTPYHALVTDFGVAKALSASTQPGGALTSIGVALGTPAYMPPEQAAADPATDHRADLYSFGALAYEMLTGRQLFAGRSPGAMMAAHATETAEAVQRVRPATPPALASLVMRCLEKRPADRPQSARELLAELDTIAISGATAVSERARARLDTRKRRVIAGAGAIAIIAILATAIALYAPRSAAAPEPRIVVLPFDNLGQPTDQYFAEGLAEEIANRLVKVPGLSVVARSSAAELKNRKQTARQIGEALNAEYVLDGSVRWAKSGSGPSTIRVTPQLIQVSNEAKIWAEPFETVLSQVFRVQADIAERVAQALNARLGTRDVANVRTASTNNVAAFDAYLAGRHEWKKRTPESLFRAIAHFERAIALDPNFSRAHGGLGDSYAVLPAYTDSIPELEAYPRAERALRRALELDPNLAEAHAGLGQVLYYRHDWLGSYRALSRALELDPGYATAHQWMGELLVAIGRTAEAVDASRRAAVLEPAMAVTAWTHGWALYANGRVREAEQEILRALRLSPTATIPRNQLAIIYAQTGQPEEAVAQFTALGVPPRMSRPFVYLRTRADTLAAAALAASMPADFTRATAYARIGITDSAIAALDRALDRNENLTVFIKTDLDLRRLRSDPRYMRLLERAGLSDAQLREAGLVP